MSPISVFNRPRDLVKFMPASSRAERTPSNEESFIA